ncbi:MAG: hypothetical protein GWO84_04765 [Euryarchaeota archaeon]|nr:hypothetical protein [Euryarchaeota archaeon]
MVKGDTRISTGWAGFIIGFLGLLFLVPMEPGTLPACCFGMFISLLIANSGHSVKKKSKNILYIQQPVQQPVQQVINHNYIPQQQLRVVQQVPVIKTTRNTPTKSAADWAMEARNLELARDWEKAAQAYQMAGRYQEAGRIRQLYLEKDDAQVKINIDRIGDNIQDSVVMKDDV